ncbi:host attachment family protein [Chelativorans sp.]|uniref:host attachment family protein n=1 Tax=Chelativorans sp. TaxID=2203393 RepID=UPI002811668F|nr:host attachment family protein [Chelativorans sp.]
MAGIRLENGIWVLVADGEKALFLHNKGDAEYPNLEVVREIRDDASQGNEPPGRSGNGGGQNATFQETDWHRYGKERFAEEIAERLYKFAHRGEFDRIIIVAPPAVLGTLRKELHKEVTARVAAELPKTLTNHTTWDIEELLKNAA